MQKLIFNSIILSACLFMIVFALLSSPVNASMDALAQVWGYEASAAGYSGQDAYLTTPNPNIGSGHWTAGPNGVTNFTDTFMESGPIKACQIDCGLHSYGSWHNSAGSGGFNPDTTLWLGAGLQYHYYVVNGIDGNANKWRAFFCSGTGCSTMVTGKLRTSHLPYIASGGESDSAGVHWGGITTSYNTFKDPASGNWYAWCYQYVQNNVNGTLSACNSGDHSWTASY